jgi:hypothetical protein
MKRLLFIVTFALLSVALSAQGLFTKIDQDAFIIKSRALDVDSIVLPSVAKFRLAYGVTGTSIDLKTGSIGFLASTGVGVTYTNFKLDAEWKPYATWGVGAMVLIANENNQPLYEVDGKVATGILIEGSLGPVSVGPSYYPSVKKLLLNFGVQFTF